MVRVGATRSGAAHVRPGLAVPATVIDIGYNHLNVRVDNSILTGPPLAPLRVDTKLDAQSHELRLDGDHGRLTGVLGLSYLKLSRDARVPLVLGPVTGPGQPGSRRSVLLEGSDARRTGS